MEQCGYTILVGIKRGLVGNYIRNLIEKAVGIIIGYQAVMVIAGAMSTLN